jgi:hypothetical protein
MTNFREEMSAETGNHQGNNDPRLKEAIVSEERVDIWENFREDHRTGNREESSRITKNRGMGIV